MRWSEIGAREMIDIYNGAKLGRLDQADMEVDPETGEIQQIIVNTSAGALSRFGRGSEARIPWDAVKQIGPQIVLIELTDLPQNN